MDKSRFKSIEQGTKEWLRLRKNYIGASDAPIIMGESPYKTPYQLWEEKLNLVKDKESNPAMRRGNFLEPIARQAYIDYTGNEVFPMLAFHESIDFMMASLDGITMDYQLPVEIKCPNEEDHQLAKKGQIPTKYYAQIQHQIAVVNCDSAHYFSFRDDDIALVEVERNDDYITKMCIKETEFWKGLVNFEAPELTEKDVVVVNDPEWDFISSQWKDLKKSIEDLSIFEKQYREQLIALCDGQTSQGNGVKVQKITRKGNVDYSKIRELKDVSLNKYRKKPVESWRLSINE
ncbi:MAG: YqaJ viral recombinase family protein [Nitrosopumilaceae archaeon]|nr:YqaJ viral recombinase family protein [Nitrosopumilaceae archaeon]